MPSRLRSGGRCRLAHLVPALHPTGGHCAESSVAFFSPVQNGIHKLNRLSFTSFCDDLFDYILFYLTRFDYFFLAARPLLLAGPFCFRPPGAGNRPPYASTGAATTRYQSYLSHRKNIICTIKITYSNYTSYHLDHSPQSHCSTLPISLPMSLCRIVLPPCRKHLSKHSQAKFRK